MICFTRYKLSAVGGAQNHARITWTSELNIPVFVGAGLDSCNCVCRVETAVLYSQGRQFARGITLPSCMMQVGLSYVIIM